MRWWYANRDVVLRGRNANADPIVKDGDAAGGALTNWFGSGSRNRKRSGNDERADETSRHSEHAEEDGRSNNVDIISRL